MPAPKLSLDLVPSQSIELSPIPHDEKLDSPTVLKRTDSRRNSRRNSIAASIARLSRRNLTVPWTVHFPLKEPVLKSNYIRTTKYTLLTFLPLNLMSQVNSLI